MTAATVRIIAVGDELLEGRTSDTNSTRMQRALGVYAVQVRDIAVVADRAEDIAAALDRTGAGDIVLVCGGLGATRDDLTREAIAAWAGVPLVYREDVAAQLAERRRLRGLPPLAAGDKQAAVPAGCEPIANPVGSAPGLIGVLRDRRVAVMPGVPAELEALLPGIVEGLRRLGALAEPRPTRLWRTAQMTEAAVARLCEPVRARHPGLRWSWWIGEWGVDVRIGAEPRDRAALDAAAADVDAALGDTVYARERSELPLVVQDLMLARRSTLAVAESCTGGLLAAAITGQAGSSGYYLGGVVSYADAAKIELLGVDPGELGRHGAVCGPVAEQMARGARARLGADWALATTGIAGPGGGSQEKPVGTTWIALAGPDGARSGGFRFAGDRDRNRRLAVAAALDVLRRELTGDRVFDAERLSWRISPR
ncbi:MAG TPA: nicotinamide-nucleotide amidohydrolase family protein [Candidatus Krumholzibacteria bacterium]|nr:nicotinamide-nucleotide amidohydrolase family protein [Candidatus Krumholzibacteria bacterium]HPD72726.1 nicotinamide-nucleotide amidohydrolase family protein [Candidatus Krumholzibacteria bacterium]HRY40342.1 nicotinamide-nucleotide amidohydrolase family protein [Candidatus Krumholzibacteria bacterium]